MYNHVMTLLVTLQKVYTYTTYKDIIPKDRSLVKQNLKKFRGDKGRYDGKVDH